MSNTQLGAMCKGYAFAVKLSELLNAMPSEIICLTSGKQDEVQPLSAASQLTFQTRQYKLLSNRVRVDALYVSYSSSTEEIPRRDKFWSFFE